MFKPDAAEQIALAGIQQSQIAARADLDPSNLNRRIKNRSRLRLTTAARIASAFAELRGISQAEALSFLFEEANNDGED